MKPHRQHSDQLVMPPWCHCNHAVLLYYCRRYVVIQRPQLSCAELGAYHITTVNTAGRPAAKPHRTPDTTGSGRRRLRTAARCSHSRRSGRRVLERDGGGIGRRLPHSTLRGKWDTPHRLMGVLVPTPFPRVAALPCVYYRHRWSRRTHRYVRGRAAGWPLRRNRR